MANTNFIVHNGLTVGPLTIDAATGGLSTTGTITSTGGSPSIFNGNIVANSNTISSSKTTGALVVNGGAGIGGNVYANAIYTDNHFFANGATITTPAGGSNTFVQFNDGSTFNGTAGLTFNKGSNVLAVSGGLGIGTTSPVNTLSIGSTLAPLVSQLQVSHPSGDWGIVTKRTANDNGNANFAFLKSRGEYGNITTGDYIGRIGWHAVTGNATTALLAELGVTNVNYDGTNADSIMYFSTKTQSGSSTERLRIDSGGNVGIGTSSPSSPGGTINLVTNSSDTTIIKSQTSSTTTGVARYDLATGTANSYFILGLYDNSGSPYITHSVGAGVLNTYYQSPTHIWKNGSGSTEYMRIDSNGNVGIGASSPVGKLDVGSTSSSFTDLIIRSNSTTGISELRFADTRNNSGYIAYNHDLDYMRFATDGIARMRIDSSGNVGIGTASPTAALHVVGQTTLGNTAVSGIYTTSGLFWANGTAFTGGATYTASSSAPSSPKSGDEWYNTSNDVLYIRANDGTSSFWLDIVSTPSSMGNLAVTGNLTVSGNVNSTIAPYANNTYNLGTVTANWGTVYAVTFSGTSTTAKYADLAENYEADCELTPGDVVIFGGLKEVTIANQSHDTRIAGVVSTQPAYLMNSESIGYPIALAGRVPCKVKGPVDKGDLLVASDYAGVAQKIDKTMYEPGCVIGKSLEKINSDETALIEVVVGRI